MKILVNEYDSDDIAYDCGDTFIVFEHLSPAEQWARITKILKEEGYYIVKVTYDSTS